MRKIIKLLILLSLSPVHGVAQAQLSAPLDGQPFVHAIAQIKRAIVRIQVVFDDGTMSTGTGFYVSDKGYAVTASHVVTAPPGRSIKGIWVATQMPTVENPEMIMMGDLNIHAATVVAADLVNDITILLTSPNPFSQSRTVSTGVAIRGRAVAMTVPIAFAEFDATPVHDGESVFISGFPAPETVVTTTSGKIASTDWAINDGRSLRRMYSADIHVNPGNSGGPVFSVDNTSVIGMCDAYQGISSKTTRRLRWSGVQARSATRNNKRNRRPAIALRPC